MVPAPVEQLPGCFRDLTRTVQIQLVPLLLMFPDSSFTAIRWLCVYPAQRCGISVAATTGRL